MTQKRKNYESGYDAGANAGYQKALADLEAARRNKPVYDSGYGKEAEGLYRQLQQRQPFSYDINSDALYRQYETQYRRQGRRAMEDTLGRAAGMTGGYGNSYAQTAGNQAYQSYLGQLNDKLPQLYSAALERWKQEGRQLQDSYDRAQAQEEKSYSRYQDTLDAYRKDLSFLQTQADQAWERGHQSYLEGYQMGQDAYERMLYLIENRGYKPTKQELLELGFTEAQAAALGR